MAATKYIVTATSAHAASGGFSRKEYAVREAELRHKSLSGAEDVTVETTAGNEVHRIPAAAPKPATRRGQRREALAEAALPDWEVAYDKPRAGYQVWRSTNDEGSWALYCTEHGELTEFATLREVRKHTATVSWCGPCTAAAKAQVAEAALAA